MPALIILLFVLLTGCSPSVPKLPKLAQDSVILAFGDSLTYGTGATEETSYPAVLQSLIGITVTRSGVPGETTAESLVRLPDVLDENTPKLMLLCIGGNDFLRGMSERVAADNIRSMIRLAKEKGADVILIGVPKFGFTLSPPDFYQKIADEFHIPYESDVMQHILINKALKADAVHPNAKGYRVFAEAIAALLKKSGAT
jgi:lysophospholipase L1-like esterase